MVENKMWIFFIKLLFLIYLKYYLWIKSKLEEISCSFKSNALDELITQFAQLSNLKSL